MNTSRVEEPTEKLKSRLVGRLRRDRAGLVAFTLLGVVFTLAMVSNYWTPVDPNTQLLADRLQGPSYRHILGTDNVGRDIASRLMISLFTALQSCGLALAIALAWGVSLGLVAGLLRGFVDSGLSRLVDVQLSLPPLLLAVGVVGALGTGLTNTSIAIGILLIPRFYRLTRVLTIESESQDYIEAARSFGASRIRLVWRHILPHIAPPLLVQISFSAAVALVAEASLSFLGLGVQPPQASLGSMTKDAFSVMAINNWSVFPPAVAMIILVLSVLVIGDSLRDALGR